MVVSHSDPPSKVRSIQCTSLQVPKPYGVWALRGWLRAATATGIVRFTGSMTPVWIFSEKFKPPPLAHPSRAHATPEASLSGPSVPRTPEEGLPPTSFARHGPGLVRAQRGSEVIHPATVHVIDVPTLDTDGAPPPPVWEAGPPSIILTQR